MFSVSHLAVGSRDFELLLRVFRLAGDELDQQRLCFSRASKLAEAREERSHGQVGSTRTHCEFAVMYRLLVVLLVVVSQRNKAQDASRLRIVGVQAEAAQQRIERFREMPDRREQSRERKSPTRNSD